MDVLKPSLEVLCAIHSRIASLRQQTWNTLSNLVRSHIGQAAILSLLQILQDGPSSKNRQGNLYRGVTEFLQKLIIEDGKNELPQVPMSLIFPALRSSIEEPHATQEKYAIDLLDSILSQESMQHALLAEADLSDMLEIVRVCAERADDRLRAEMIGGGEKSPDISTRPALPNGNARNGQYGVFLSLLQR